MHIQIHVLRPRAEVVHGSMRMQQSQVFVGRLLGIDLGQDSGLPEHCIRQEQCDV